MAIGALERRSLVSEPRARDSAALRRARAATESVWNSIEQEWGLLNPDEVDQREGEVRIAIRRNGRTVFPGFQFDAAGRPLPWVAPLMELARERGHSPEDVMLWVVAPTTFLGAERNRPVDHLADSELIVRVASASWDPEW